jgi:DNA-binding PadR family transcriptional regulator
METTGAVKDFVRGAVRLHVLHHAAQTEVHGAWMSKELAEHGYAISPGTLYPTLHRMEEEGLLTSREVVVDGRRRRAYVATTAGEAALAEMRVALSELADEVLGTRTARRMRRSGVGSR